MGSIRQEEVPLLADKQEISQKVYPSYLTCKGTECNDSPCTCEKFQIFREENDLFSEDLVDAKTAQKKLVEIPFRQFRNSYAFYLTLTSGLNTLFIGMFGLALGVAASLTIVCLPPLLFFPYHYFKGRRDEQKANRHLAARINSLEEDILKTHERSVKIRINSKSPKKEITKKFNAINDDKSGITEYHENDNGVGHFFAASASTLSILYTLTKLTFVVSILGGPATWAIAGVIALGVGAYFCYSRIKQLNAVRPLQNKIHLLGRRKDEMHEMVANELENQLQEQKEILKGILLPTSKPAPQAEGIALQKQTQQAPRRRYSTPHYPTPHYSTSHGHFKKASTRKPGIPSHHETKGIQAPLVSITQRKVG